MDGEAFLAAREDGFKAFAREEVVEACFVDACDVQFGLLVGLGEEEEDETLVARIA